MDDVILLETRRSRLFVLSRRHARLVAAYFRLNAGHLDPWEPLRSQGFHAVESWHKRGRTSEAEYELGTSLRLVALAQGSDQMVASCNFTNIQRGPFQACTLGYSVAEAHQGQGLMQEILEVATCHVFETLGLHRIMANYIPENVRSGRLLARLGFETEGLARAYLKINGQWRDHVLTAKINPRCA